MTDGARRAAEAVARASYGRLVALVAVRSRDIATAEDALADALCAALETWPVRGVPEKPEAWLLTAARRRLGHAARAGRVRAAAAPTLERLQEEALGLGPGGGFPDRRLGLMFACAHPAIDAAIRTPLMLQSVLGLDAKRIGAAFLMAPAAMGQRLVRAKAKIRDAGIRLEVPDVGDLPERLDAVLSAIYTAFGAAWGASPGVEGREGLADEAIWLGRVVVGLLPGEPEAHGLLALMLHCEARRAARRGPSGCYIPLAEQDSSLWSRPLIAEAESLLRVAAREKTPGRFQTEAAIQSLHVERGLTGRANTPSLVALYDLLAAQAQSVGVSVARAAVHGEAFGPTAGLVLLDSLAGAPIAAYQPYWAVRGHLLRRAGRTAEAVAALVTAAGLTEDAGIRVWLLAKATETEHESAARAIGGV